MTLIGSSSLNCEETDIFRFGSVKNIWVYSDDSGIRALEMKLTNGSKFDYGTQKDLDSLAVEEFEFDKGKQLLGLYG